MVDTTPTRLGNPNLAAPGSEYDLFLTKYAGEVLAVFERMTSARKMFSMRNISNGDSATFPAYSRAVAAYHTAGENILDPSNSLLTEFGIAERVINVDQLLQSSTFVDRLDEMLNHWEVRSGFADQMGQALARKEDEQLFQLAVLASRAASTITTDGGGTGGSVTSTDAEDNSATLIDKIFECAETFDTLDVPKRDRFCALRPAQYYMLIADTAGGVTDMVNKDFTTENGGADEGIVKSVAGIQIINTNSVPFNEIVTEDTEARNDYFGTFTTTVGVCFHKTAVGSINMAGLSVESEYMSNYQGTFMIAKMAVGHGILRPESAIEILDTTMT